MDLNVENVLVYVDDAVRYDALAEDLPSLGPTYRTVAASTHTPTSFGALLTGLLPTRNSIHSFKHTVPSDVRSLFDLSTHEVSLAVEGGMNHSIAEMFRNPPRARIAELDPPFIHVVRRPGGHAPYDRFEWDTYEYADETAVEYLWEVAGEPDRARREYYSGVRTAFSEFKRVLDCLEERGLRKETLVVYTSDHGEMLGEHGFFGHTHMATPEVVYVPTTMVHPDLTPSRRDGLFHHVDLLPTIEEALSRDVDVGLTDGVARGEGRTTGYTHLEHTRYGSLPGPAERVLRVVGGFERVIKSLWDRNGGHVFVDGSLVPVTLVYLGLLVQHPFGRHVYRDGAIRGAYRRFTPGHQSYGSPAFSKADALSEIETRVTSCRTGEAGQIDEETTERLESMGYI